MTLYVKLIAALCERRPIIRQTLLDAAPASKFAKIIDVAIVMACLEMFYSEADNAVRNHAAFHLIQAVDAIRRSENAQWRN